MANKLNLIIPLFIFFLIPVKSLIGQEMVIVYGLDSQQQIEVFKKEALQSETSPGAKRMAEVSLKAQIEAQKSTYSLEIEEGKSFFYLNDIMLSEANGEIVNQLAKMNSDKGNFYQNAATKQILQREAGSKTIISYGYDFFEWNLSKETEKILGYNCYKATTQFTEPHPAGGKDLMRNIIVWYTTDLPFNFGPQGYGGLPGLILKKCQSGSCFIATEIKSKNVAINWPEEETISRKEYFEKVKTTKFKFD